MKISTSLTLFTLSLGFLGGLYGIGKGNQEQEKKELEALYQVALTNQPSPSSFLKDLARLDLSNIKLEVVPQSVGTMEQLRKLDLTNNRLTGLPMTLQQLKKLKRLDLSRNKFAAFPPVVPYMDNLQELNMRNNSLGTLPPEIGSLSKMKRLRLGHNMLEALPDELGQLSNLRELEAHNNRLATLPRTLNKLRKMKNLNIMQNPLGEGSQDPQGTRACSLALALYRIIGKSCIQSSFELLNVYNSVPKKAHAYMHTTLKDLFARANNQDDTFSGARIAEILATDGRFCSALKQSLSNGKKQNSQEDPDPTLPAMVKLKKDLHYYRWLKALYTSKRAYCINPFSQAPFNGFCKNLRLLLWSLINDQ